ncbi:MAG: hypothetical protein ACHQVS_04565 [Candidatus Babeliales bacterium]
MFTYVILALMSICFGSYTCAKPISSKKEVEKIVRACQETDAWMEAHIDVNSCDPNDIRSEDTIRAYAKRLCALLSLNHEIIGNEPTITYYGGNKQTNGFLLMLPTSQAHFTARFVNMTNTIYLTISSKKAFDPYEIAEATKKFFKARDCSTNVTLR